ncbi:MAG: TetR/AcrR family transcriptional regulator [Coprobacillaceae bacterium]
MNFSNLEEERKITILNSALKEFSIKGYDKASTNVIAKEAGISKGLMFHYVGSKQELFLFVYDYFNTLLEHEYYAKMDMSTKDIFERLRQSYLLQLNLIRKYPWIFDFDKLFNKTKSDEINKEHEKRNTKTQDTCDTQIFDEIDVSSFREGLDIEKCKQFILWSNIGFTNQILDDIKTQKNHTLNYDDILFTLDDYFDELRKVFYTSNVSTKGLVMSDDYKR